MKNSKEPLIPRDFNGSFFHKNLKSWYERYERPLPWRVLWKKHRDPWHIWVSEIMLQQTVIKAVIPVYERFIKRFPTFEALAAANSEEIRLEVRGLGYYRRFDLLHRACMELARDGRGLPQKHHKWLELPGIGTYTAAAIASITKDEPFGVVDGNVERVLCRLLDIRLEPNLPHLKKHFKQLMDQACSRGYSGTVNQAVMELGQTICTPTNPACNLCPINKMCSAFKENSQHLAPAPKSKPQLIDVEMQLSIVAHRKKILLCRRPDDAKFLKGTWGFFTAIRSRQEFHYDGQQQYGLKLSNKKVVGRVKHSITKHKIMATVQALETSKLPKTELIRSVDPRDVEENLVSNLDRKAWVLLQKKLNLD